MKQEMRIIANLDEPDILKKMVETLASGRVDLGYENARVPQQWKAIETSTNEAFVLGTIDLHFTNNYWEEQISLPFTSSFLFTCIKEKYGSFNLEWSSSLS